jgi:hypothetical protein
LIRNLKVELKHMDDDGNTKAKKRLVRNLEKKEEAKFINGPDYYKLLPKAERLAALLADNAKEYNDKINDLNSKDSKIVDDFVQNHKCINWETDFKLFDKILNYA